MMRRLYRGLLVLLAITVVIAAVSALCGALYVHFHGGTTYGHSIAFAMWIGGGLVALLAGGSGSTSRMLGALLDVFA